MLSSEEESGNDGGFDRGTEVYDKVEIQDDIDMQIGEDIYQTENLD